MTPVREVVDTDEDSLIVEGYEQDRDEEEEEVDDDDAIEVEAEVEDYPDEEDDELEGEAPDEDEDDVEGDEDDDGVIPEVLVEEDQSIMEEEEEEEDQAEENDEDDIEETRSAAQSVERTNANSKVDTTPKDSKVIPCKAASTVEKPSRMPAVKGLTIPFRTVKKSMKLDPDIPIVQNESAIMVTMAAELFVKSLAADSYRNARSRARFTIRYEDIAEARANKPSLAFLEPLLP
jgi:histone H3/H4